MGAALRRIVSTTVWLVGLAGFRGDLKIWWNGVIPALVTTAVGYIAWLQYATAWQIGLVALATFVVLFLLSIPAERALRRWRAPEGNSSAATNIGHADTYTITSHNQMGGQTAGNITNLGSQPRTVSEASANALVAELRQHPGEGFSIAMYMGNPDAERLGRHLKDILCRAGWSANEESLVMPVVTRVGVLVVVPEDTPQARILGNCLVRTGLQPEVVLDENSEQIRIIVGARD